MSEPIVEPKPIDHEAIAVQLRTANTELSTKYQREKQRATELEAAMTAKDSEISQLQSTVRQITIDGPLKAMAEQMSTAPELWLEQFSKAYKVEMIDGKLALRTTDGKPVVKGDKPVPFERQALVDLLTNEAHPNSKSYRALTVVSKASGAATIGTQRRTAETEAPKKIQFGLR